MPETPEATRKNLYVRSADRWIWNRAEQVAGDSLSAFVAEALRSHLHLTDRELLAAAESELRKLERLARQATEQCHAMRGQLEAVRADGDDGPEAARNLARLEHECGRADALAAEAHSALVDSAQRLVEIRQQVSEREGDVSDRLVVDLWDGAGYRHQKTFRGHWVLAPTDDYHAHTFDAKDAIWSVAETVKGRFAVYSIEVDADPSLGEERGDFAVYESFDTMAAAIPWAVREEVRTRTGRVEVEELDI